MPNGKGRKSSFGSLRVLPSGRIQARYTGLDGLTHTAPVTFDTRLDAQPWLSTVRATWCADCGSPPATRNPCRSRTTRTLGWGDRTLKPRTRAHYRRPLDSCILPTFRPFTLKSITPDVVHRWHAELGSDRPTLRAHAYELLRSILGSAVADQLVVVNPAHIRGAGTSKRVHEIKPLSLEELETLVAAIRPAKYRLMALLAAWCALRFGELAELRRGDIDFRRGVIHVRRAVVRTGGQTIVSTPESDAGTRDVNIPPHLVPMVKEHDVGG